MPFSRATRQLGEGCERQTPPHTSPPAVAKAGRADLNRRPSAAAESALIPAGITRAITPPPRNPGCVAAGAVRSLVGGAASSRPCRRPDIRNLFPEPHSTSYKKDHLENSLNNDICDGTISLRKPQREIVDWPAYIGG